MVHSMGSVREDEIRIHRSQSYLADEIAAKIAAKEFTRRSGDKHVPSFRQITQEKLHDLLRRAVLKALRG